MDVFDLFPNLSDHLLGYHLDLVTAYTPTSVFRPRTLSSDRRGGPRDEGHLEINLSEFRLPVFTTVLVAETAGQLIIFVDTARADQ